VSVSAVWGSAANDVWLGTELGELYHYDGSTISAFDRETFALPIVAIHGTGADDVFALSEHQLAHFDGRRWSSVAVPGDYVMRDVWAHPERVFVVGFDGFDPLAFVPTIVRTTSWTAE